MLGQGRRVHHARQQDGGRERHCGQRAEFRDRPASASDNQALAGGDAVDDVATVVAGFSDCDLCHARYVSRVRHSPAVE